jgi:hypothetical protein
MPTVARLLARKQKLLERLQHLGHEDNAKTPKATQISGERLRRSSCGGNDSPPQY